MLNLRRAPIDGFTILGHRGVKGHAPENTLVSFEKGIQMGSTMLELDIHLSKDKELIVIHDGAVDRTTNGTGLVHEMTLTELQRLDAGAWFGPEFAGERIPTLQEVIGLVRGRAYLNVEIKVGGMNPNRFVYPDIIQPLGDLLTTTDMVNEVVVSSFHQPYLTELKQVLPNVRVALLHQKPVDNLFETAVAEGWEAVHTHTSLIDEQFVAAAHAKGIRVRAWNPNDAETMRRMIHLGVDGIGTDFPEVLLQLAREAGRVR